MIMVELGEEEPPLIIFTDAEVPFVKIEVQNVYDYIYQQQKREIELAPLLYKLKNRAKSAGKTGKPPKKRSPADEGGGGNDDSWDWKGEKPLFNNINGGKRTRKKRGSKK